MATFMPTGINTKPYPSAVIGSPAIIGVKAVADPGGCKHLNSSMARTLAPTAKADAKAVSVKAWAHATPIVADMSCPPTSGQGCASGLLGMINKITADAPIEATIIGYAVFELYSCVIYAVSKMALKHETTEMSLPLRLKLIGSTVIKRKNGLMFIMSGMIQVGVTKKASA